ncbi:MAG TPA: tRNA (adenosine(37)-N6)-dimethylallyltransferase MiaA, partial [Candidatus Dormibacteraeota bacterium]|nr:tRNA (adenosine(37)-N6)-dimethylallyltransferase MiaA [Candidatus Dormibacteraeota bacterium]
VSADSRQVYRHCDIGTNKPTQEELRGIACHLLDVVDPDATFTVADYVPLAASALGSIWAQKRLPVLQGGTGLYVRALLDGWNLADAPPDPELRARLEQRITIDGPAALDDQLRAIDPAAADRAQGNPRRTIRALEIYSVTGRPPSLARRADPPDWKVTAIGLSVPLDELDRRIEQRVLQMVDAGFVDEVATVRRDFPRADFRRLGHGYPEMAAHLEGKLPLAGAVESTVLQVRQYARRQLTWFRADQRVRWIAPDLDVAMPLLRAAMMGGEAI